jgi:pilus assembly protein CpaB
MKSKVVLLLSLVMAVVTTTLFFQYMKKFDVFTTVTHKNTIGVVVAVDQIDKNERIVAEKLKLVEMEESSAHPQALKNLDEVIGRMATSTIVIDEQILSHRIISENEETTYVSRKINDGYRAISIGVNINQSVTNLIEPDDEVDVILTRRKKIGEIDKVVSDYILIKVRVLAVGRKMVNPEDTVEPYVEYSSVTLELKPEDALTLTRSTEEGTIHIILNQRPIETEEKHVKSDKG